MRGSWFHTAVVFLLILAVAACAEPDEKLIQAVKEGSHGKAQNALKKGASPNVTDETGTPALLLALQKGRPEIAGLLIQHGAKNVNAAIILAVQGGYENLVSLLLERGADASIADKQGNTLIDIAVAAGRDGVVPRLREAGVQTCAEIQQAEEAQRRLEQAAAEWFAGVREGDLERMRRAREAGVDPDRRTPYAAEGWSESSGWTALMIAAQQRRMEIVRWLLDQGADVNAKNQHGRSALGVALTENHVELIKLLAENGADLETRDRSGSTALGKMAWEGNRDLVTFLLAQGADPNAMDGGRGTDFRGNTLTLKFVPLGGPPLSSALRKGFLDIAKQLVEAGADVNLYTDGWTMLHQETLWGRAESVKFLLEHGANPTLPLKGAGAYADGCQPLIFAAIDGNAEIVNLLLEHGADPGATYTIRGHVDQNALYFAELEGHEEAARILKAATPQEQ
jgi:cytohesin